MQRSFNSLIQFLLSFSGLPLIIRLIQPMIGTLMAAFRNQPHRESHYRSLEAGGEFCLLQLRLGGRIKWVSATRTERPKLLKHKALRRLKG